MRRTFKRRVRLLYLFDISKTEQDCFILITASYFIRLVASRVKLRYTSLHRVFTHANTIVSVDSVCYIFGASIRK